MVVGLLAQTQGRIFLLLAPHTLLRIVSQTAGEIMFQLMRLFTKWQEAEKICFQELSTMAGISHPLPRAPRQARLLSHIHSTQRRWPQLMVIRLLTHQAAEGAVLNMKGMAVMGQKMKGVSLIINGEKMKTGKRGHNFWNYVLKLGIFYILEAKAQLGLTFVGFIEKEMSFWMGLMLFIFFITDSVFFPFPSIPHMSFLRLVSSLVLDPINFSNSSFHVVSQAEFVQNSSSAKVYWLRVHIFNKASM